MRIAREYFLTEDLTHRGCPGCDGCPGACAGTSVGGAEDLIAELELHKKEEVIVRRTAALPSKNAERKTQYS